MQITPNIFKKLNLLYKQIKKGMAPPVQAIKILGDFIDSASDIADAEAADKGIQFANKLLTAELSDRDRALINYFSANAWAIKEVIESKVADSAWAWRQENLEQQLFSLRKACVEPGFSKLPKGYQCSILTNLANLLDRIGRFVEAPEVYDRAIAIAPDFGMAIGNKGHALMSYGRADYDIGHQVFFLCHAHKLLKEALKQPLPNYAEKGFSGIVNKIEKSIKDPRQELLRLSGKPNSLGGSKAEVVYRKWCLSKNLFLNPLNDIGPFEMAAHDPLLLPSMTTTIKEPPWFFGLFNQLKQEYVTARYFLYEGISAEANHFSDKGVYLVDTLDYTAHCLAQERIKVAFRVAYSILDKLAFFLNEYFKLGLKENRIYFSTVWYNNGDFNQGLRQEFVARKNLSLRGLYWISRDIFEEAAPFVEALEPDARKLKSIRNHLEHKYIKIQDFFREGADERHPMYDPLALRVSRNDFNQKALRVLKLTRAALIYLSFGIHREERGRGEGKKPDLIAPMFTNLIADKYKT